MDSFQVIELILCIEEDARPTLPTDEVLPILTLGDAYDYYLELKNAGTGADDAK